MCLYLLPRTTINNNIKYFYTWHFTIDYLLVGLIIYKNYKTKMEDSITWYKLGILKNIYIFVNLFSFNILLLFHNFISFSNL